MECFFKGKGEFEFGKTLLDVEGVFVGHGSEGAAGGIGIFFEGGAQAVVAEEGDEGGVEQEREEEVVG